MRLTPSVAWSIGDPPVPLDARLLPLLQAIVHHGSLAAAVIHCGLSYRAGWGLLRAYEHTFRAPLVDLQRGRGAQLAPLGRQVLDTTTAAGHRLARTLPSLGAEIAIGAPRVAATTTMALRLRVAASHDLALADLRDSLVGTALGAPAGEAPRTALALDIAFMGSLHALERYVEGAVDLAGFHVPIDGSVPWDPAVVRHRLRARRDRLIRFVERDQGLILPRGNPGHVRSFRDIAARGLRFVNRQAGSGTRLIIERILQREGIAPARVKGFPMEEFTHPAVAATVASGGADAGFGLRAAAEGYGLAFVPMVHEAYFLAVRASAVRGAAVRALIECLQAPEFAQRVGALPGYRAPGAGMVVGVDALDDSAA